MIRGTDRVAAVLARDERLIEVFIRVSPHFERLRNPAMRKTMAKLVTVEQAARIAGVDPAVLIAELNRALGVEAADGRGEESGAAPGGEGVAGGESQGLPVALRALPPERIVDLDVRDDLRAGREPFSRIMATRRALPPGGVLRLRAIFEPVPLYAVMGKQGFNHWTERLAEDDWRVWFYPAELDAAPAPASEGSPADAPRPGADPGASGARGGGPDEDAGAEDVVVLDVRGLEPPEPMVRTLEALERLPAGKTLVQINHRVPRFLLPQLEARGFVYEVHEQPDGLVRVFIRREAGDSSSRT